MIGVKSALISIGIKLLVFTLGFVVALGIIYMVTLTSPVRLPAASAYSVALGFVFGYIFSEALKAKPF